MITTQALIDKFRYALDNKWGYIWGASGGTWTEADQRKATRKQTIEYGSRWIGHRVADCSGLFTWAFKQLGGTMYHGSNTMYKSYCTNKGKINKNTVLKPGTAVFTGSETEHGHVGLYIGAGEVIEAKGTQYGVVKGKLSEKKWTYWGELKGVDYSTAEGEPVPERTLRRGDKGEDVAALQTSLRELGYDLGPCGIDGDFGSATEKAVKLLQRACGLKDDGIVGKDTRAALSSKLDGEMTYSVRITGLSLDEAQKIQDILRSEGRVVTIMKGGAT